MSDVVQWLRVGGGRRYKEVADEIERLRLQVKAANAVTEEHYAEIERLRADLLTRDGQAQELQGQVARLRGLLREAMKELGYYGRLAPTLPNRTWRDLDARVNEALGE